MDAGLIAFLGTACLCFIGITYCNFGEDIDKWIMNVLRKPLYYTLNRQYPGWNFDVLEIMHDNNIKFDQYEYVVKLCLGDVSFKRKTSNTEINKCIDNAIGSITNIIDYYRKNNIIVPRHLSTINDLLRIIHKELS